MKVIKKLIKDNIKFIFGAIVGMIVSTVVAYGTTILYNSNEVLFVPEDKEWDVDNVESAINDLYNMKNTNLDNLERLWKPLAYSDTSGTYSYTGTYTFTKKYKYVIAIYYTESAPATTYRTTNIVPINTINISSTKLDNLAYIYKNVTSGASIYFSFSNLQRASIAVYGIE